MLDNLLLLFHVIFLDNKSAVKFSRSLYVDLEKIHVLL